MKKITVFTTVHPYYDNRIYLKQINALLKRYIVDFFVTENNITVKLPNSSNLFFHFIKKPTNRLKRLWNGYVIIQRLLKTKADLYLFHDFELIPIGLILKFFNKKVIFDMHEDFLSLSFTSAWIPNFLKTPIYILNKLMLKISKRKFDFIFIAEDGYKKYFTNYSKYEIIHNYPKIKNSISFPKKREPYSLVYLGSITEERGIWEMLKLTKRLKQDFPETKLHLIGKIYPEELEKSIVRFIKLNKLQNNVIIHGFIPNNKVYEIITKFSIGLVLLHEIENYKTSIATKIYEYMLFKIPILASNFSIWEEIINRVNAGYVVKYNDTKSQYKICKMLFNTPDLVNKLGNNGFEYVKKYYSWENEEIKFLNIIENILNK